MTLEEFRRLDPDTYTLIDMRGRSEYDYGFIPGCLTYTEEELRSLTASDACPFPKDRLLVLYCRYGNISRQTASDLGSLGWRACSLQGGYAAWVLDEVRRQADSGTLRQDVEHSIQKRFHIRLMGPFARAILKYRLIEEGDKIAVCISGGKDSMLMAKLFQEFQKHGHVNFDLKFLVMDPGYNDANRAIIENNLRSLGIPGVFFDTKIFDAVYTIESSPCYLCARMRRGYLYRYAMESGCNKIALGHHYDDVIETALMGMLYSGQWSAMMPKLRSTNFPGMELIRPMYFIREDDIKLWRDENHLHFLQCACRFTDSLTAGSDEASESKRLETKRLIAKLKQTNPQIETNIFHATENVTIDKLLGYKKNGVRHSFLDDYDQQHE